MAENNWWEKYSTAQPEQPQAVEARGAAPEGDEWFDKYQTADPSPQAQGQVDPEKAATVTAGSASRGAITAGPMMAGAFMGGKIGMLGGPFAPVTAPAGAIIGAGAGYMAGEEIADFASRFGLASPAAEEVEPEYRPYAYGGEIFGSSVFGAGAITNLAQHGMRLPKSFVGNWINRALDKAARAPIFALAAETGAATTAGIGAGTAEVLAPGDPLARMGGEVIGGMVPTTSLVVNGAELSIKLFRGAFKSFSSAAQKSMAGDTLRKIITEAGGDVNKVVELLRDAENIGALRTSSQIAGAEGKGLAQLEQTFKAHSKQFGAEHAEMQAKSLELMEKFIFHLRNDMGGDPEALKLAARLEQNRFKALISSRIQQAEDEAMRAVGKITGDTAESREALSVQARQSLQTALEQTRGVERELWESVDKTTAATADNTIGTLQALKDELLPEESMPAILEGFLKRRGKDPEGAILDDVTGLEADALAWMAKQGDEAAPEPLTVAEMVKLRSRALELARSAEVKGEYSDARRYGMVAEAVLDDLDAIGDPAYAEARAFSRELNEAFTRSFAGHAMAKGTRGDRLPPEIMMERALATGGARARLQLQELENAVNFLDDMGRLDPENMVDTSGAMMDAQERLIRLAASETATRTKDGDLVVTPDKLREFIKKNKKLIDKFPGLSEELADAITSSDRLNDVARTLKPAPRIIEKQAAFSKVLKGEAPAKQVQKAMVGDNPTRDIRQLAKLAKRGGPEAVQGLRAAAIDAVFMRASRGDKGLDFNEFSRVLFEPSAPGQPAIAEILKKQGVFNDTELSTIKKFADIAKKMAEVKDVGAIDLEKLEGVGSAVETLVFRMLGARLASKAAEAAGGQIKSSGLIIAGQGAGFATRIFQKMPRQKAMQFMMDALLDPGFMRVLLETPTSPAEAMRLTLKIHSYALQSVGSYVGRELPEIEDDTQ